MLTHRGLTNNARLAAEAIGWTPDDVLVNPMPYFHIAGCGLMVLGLAQSLSTHVVMPGFSPQLMLELIARHRGTVIGGVPTMLTAILAQPAQQHDLSSLRMAMSGGATAAGADPAGGGGVRGPVRAHVRADRVRAARSP